MCEASTTSKTGKTSKAGNTSKARKTGNTIIPVKELKLSNRVQLVEN